MTTNDIHPQQGNGHTNTEGWQAKAENLTRVLVILLMSIMLLLIAWFFIKDFGSFLIYSRLPIPATNAAVWFLLATCVAAIIYVGIGFRVKTDADGGANQTDADGGANQTDADGAANRAGRYLAIFWYIVWAIFTVVWLINRPEATGAVRLADYLIIVTVPAFFPVSAIAYTAFQNPRKIENLQEQFKLLGIVDDKGATRSSNTKSGNPIQVKTDEIVKRYKRTHSAASFSTQTILPVLLSVIGAFLIIFPARMESVETLLAQFDKATVVSLQDSLSNSDQSMKDNLPEARAIAEKISAAQGDISAVQENLNAIQENLIDVRQNLNATRESLDATQEGINSLRMFMQGDFATISLNGTLIQALRFGFLGAYIFCVQLVYRRYTTLDLKPSIYMQCTATLLAGFAFNYVAFEAITEITGVKGPTTGLGAGLVGVIAFSLGYFPGFAIRWFNRIAYRAVGSSAPKYETLPLSQIDGLSEFHEVRLRDEGIDNIQNLASAHVEDLVVNTPFNTLQLIDWIDQAVLRLYVGKKEVDAFRRGGVRGISDFRDLWRRSKHRDNGNNGVDQKNHTAQHEKDWTLTREDLAARLQSTTEQLAVLYLATDAAPNLAFLDYPRKYNEVVRRRQAKQLSAINDKEFFLAFLDYMTQLKKPMEINKHFINVFRESKYAEDQLSNEEKNDYALQLARWHTKLYELATTENDVQAIKDSGHAALEYYEKAEAHGLELSDADAEWLAENKPTIVEQTD